MYRTNDVTRGHRIPRFKFRSIRTKLVVSFSLVFVATLAIVTLLGLRGVPLTPYQGRLAHGKAEVFGSLSLTADLKKELLLRWLEELRDDAHVSATNRLVADAVCRLRETIGELAAAGETGSRLWSGTHGTATYQTLAAFLTDFRDTYGVYERIHIAEAQSGMIIASTDETDFCADVSNFTPFIRALSSGDDYVSDVEARENAHPVFHIAHVIQGEGGETIAVLLLEVSTEDIVRRMVLASGQLGRTGEALLVNRDARILTSLKYKLPDGTTARPLEYQIQARPAVLAAGGGEGLIEANDYRGEPVLAAYRHIPVTPEFGWGLVVKRDKDELFASVREEVNYTALTAVLGILAIIVLTCMVARRLTGPLLSLSDTADRVAAGDLEARVVVSGRDEVGALAATFNTMIQGIRDSHEHLEERVRSRTAALNKANVDLEAEILHHKHTEGALRDREETLRAIVETAVDGIVTIDARGAIQSLNPAAERMFGYTMTEVMGKNVALLAAEPARSEHDEYIARYLTTGEKHIIGIGREALGQRKDGTVLPVELAVSEAQVGEQRMFVGMIRDITERALAAKALQDSEDRFKDFFDKVPIGFHILGPDRVISDINEAELAMIGYAHNEVVGKKTWADLIIPEQRERFEEHWGEMITTGEVHDLEYTLVHKKGHHVDVILNGSTRFDEHGNFRNTRGSVLDVTERKRAEEKLRLQGAALEAAANTIVITDREGRLLWANNAFTQLTGYTYEEATGKTLSILKSGVHAPSFYKELWDTILSGRVWHGELVNRRKDGSTYFEEMTVTPVFDVQGEITRFIAIKQDITGRRRAEEELRGSKAMQQLVMDTIPQHIFWKDRDSVYLGCNENFARVAGVGEPQNVIGRTDYDLAWKKEEADFFRECDRRVMEADTPEYHIIEPQLQGDGKQAWLDTNKVPLHDVDGKVVGILGTYEDVTERKQVEEERRNLQDQLLQARKMEVVGQLAGGVAHDFNNILTAILGNAEMLLSKLDRDPAAISTEFARNGLNEIQHAGERATALTRRLLGFSRKQMVRPEVLNPCRVLANTETMLRRLVREDVVLDMRVDPKVSCIRSDAAQIEQVIMNLVVNACDAMPDGGRLIVECTNAELDDAHVAAHPEASPGAHVVFSVKDEGTGMSLEIISRIFEPFFTTKPVGRGTGLGLATAYGIAAQAGGHITVESAPGEGSTFRVYIPAVAEKPVESRADSSADDLRGEELVLVCEDEDLVRRVTCHILREAGYTVLEAENGKRALEVAANHDGTIDLLITDLVMPEMNGKELAEQMAARYPEMRIVFASGYTADVVDRQVGEHELENFLQKPFSPAALLQHTRDALAKRILATTHKH